MAVADNGLILIFVINIKVLDANLEKKYIRYSFYCTIHSADSEHELSGIDRSKTSLLEHRYELFGKRKLEYRIRQIVESSFVARHACAYLGKYFQ